MSSPILAYIVHKIDKSNPLALISTITSIISAKKATIINGGLLINDGETEIPNYVNTETTSYKYTKITVAQAEQLTKSPTFSILEHGELIHLLKEYCANYSHNPQEL